MFISEKAVSSIMIEKNHLNHSIREKSIKYDIFKKHIIVFSFLIYYIKTYYLNQGKTENFVSEVWISHIFSPSR